MIYTVTFNPSLDYVVRVSDFMPGQLHRTQAEELFVGGKGINVSIVLGRLGAKSVALGFVAGFTGKEIIRRLNELDISSDFISLSQGISRINIKLKSRSSIDSADDTETEINAQGPQIDSLSLEEFHNKLDALKAGDFLVLSGSVPRGMPEADWIYLDICRRVKEAGINIVVDAEGDLLRNALSERPFLIKPNKEELEKLYGQRFEEEEAILDCAMKLHKEGARNVMVSLGENGALLLDEHGEFHRLSAPAGRVQNSVGAGDSMIAGFLAMLSRIADANVASNTNTNTNTDKYADMKTNIRFTSADYYEALKYGIAAGSAGAFSRDLPQADLINEIYHKL